MRCQLVPVSFALFAALCVFCVESFFCRLPAAMAERPRLMLVRTGDGQQPSSTTIVIPRDDNLGLHRLTIIEQASPRLR